jgi:DNA polymerase-3 subunit epsilon
MNPLASALEFLLGGPRVGGVQEERLSSWWQAPGPDLALPHGQARYVVVDTETTGLDLVHDRLIAIGAVGVGGGCVDFGDCFETVLRQDKESPDDNILIHGIGGQTQLGGIDPREGMLQFLEYLRNSPLVAFRAEFDQTMVTRGLKSILGIPFRHPWIDLAILLPPLFPKNECTSLDDWLRYFGLGGGARHHALADAMATAQLLQITLDAAAAEGITNGAQLLEMQKAQRWLGRR